MRKSVQYFCHDAKRLVNIIWFGGLLFFIGFVLLQFSVLNLEPGTFKFYCKIGMQIIFGLIYSSMTFDFLEHYWSEKQPSKVRVVTWLMMLLTVPIWIAKWISLASYGEQAVDSGIFI